MTSDELRALKPGDIIRNASGLGYVVTANYGNRMTAVRTVEVSNPDEWTLVDSVMTDAEVEAFRSEFMARHAGPYRGQVPGVSVRLEGPEPGRSVVVTVVAVLVLAAVLGGVAYVAGLI